MQPYSPERRTALVLCGTGAHGAYHAGVLRALQEAGVKIDVMAGQGVGAAAAALAAIDGAAHLWDAEGPWRAPLARTFYRWKWPLRAAAWLSPILAVLIAVPFSLFGRTKTARRRASRRRWWWGVLGAPIDADAARKAFAESIWQLIRGASQSGDAPPAAMGARYAEVLADSLGQPGFRELMLVVTDLDVRRDLVAALLREPYRHDFMAPRAGSERRSEAIDLAGAGREHAFDLIAAALTPPVACDPHLMTFGVESFWRGETHRLCDRPGACARLLDELAAAGISQAIIVSAVAAAAAPHRLSAPRLDPRHRLADFLAAAESAALRDGIEMGRLRFDSVYVIAPAHNPVGAFDMSGAYDEASDRYEDLTELMDRAYEDAYRQFIEPVVGASGERLARAASESR